jgi:hypothetical protein
MSDFGNQDRKEHRRKKLNQKNSESFDSYREEDYKARKKNKQQLKNKISEMKEEELWDDWENYQ